MAVVGTQIQKGQKSAIWTKNGKNLALPETRIILNEIYE